MEYVLMIWTAVAAAGGAGSGAFHRVEYDWRPIATFSIVANMSRDDAHSKCQAAARELGLKQDRFRCILTK